MPNLPRTLAFVAAPKVDVDEIGRSRGGFNPSKSIFLAHSLSWLLLKLMLTKSEGAEGFNPLEKDDLRALAFEAASTVDDGEVGVSRGISPRKKDLLRALALVAATKVDVDEIGGSRGLQPPKRDLLRAPAFVAAPKVDLDEIGGSRGISPRKKDLLRALAFVAATKVDVDEIGGSRGLQPPEKKDQIPGPLGPGCCQIPGTRSKHNGLRREAINPNSSHIFNNLRIYFFLKRGHNS